MKIIILGIIFLISGCVQKNDVVTNICLEGHLYINYKNMLASKLDDEGKPIKCPENQKNNPSNDSETKKLTERAENWLKFIDKKDFKGSWENAAPFFKNAITEKEWVKKASEGNKQLGNLVKRKAHSFKIEGMRATIIFKSDFEKFPQATETISMILVEGNWLPVGYLIQ